MIDHGIPDALDLLMRAYEQVDFSPRVRARLKHAIDRLDRPLEAHLFGDSRILVPETEDAAIGLLQSMAQRLEDAAEALDAAAERLKNLGQIMPATRAKQAASAAHQAASELVSA